MFFQSCRPAWQKLNISDVSTFGKTLIIFRKTSWSLKIIAFYKDLDRLITTLRISKYPVKNTTDLGPAGQNMAENHQIQEKKKIAFNYSDPGTNLGKIKQPFSLAEMKNLAFQKRSKNSRLHQRANHPYQKQ